MIKKSYKYYALSFILPLLILLFFAFCYNIAPFGENSFLVIDMKGQYVSFFSYYKQLFSGNADPLYTFSKALGGNTFSVIGYYLLSPFNFLLLLFPLEKITTGIVAVVFAKICCCCVSFSFLLKRLYGIKYSNIIFSLTYAFMSYNIIYLQNVMWLDGVVFLPIIIVGILDILEDKPPFLYIISLAAAIISNYYIGYMICFFSVIFFCYTYLSKNKKLVFAPIIKYGISSFLAVCL